MIIPKLIILITLSIIVFIGYFIYVGKIYKEQFVVAPLTYIHNKDTIFLITQNLYCYDNIIQVVIEKAVGASIIVNILPADWKKQIIDLIRQSNEGNTDEFALGYNNGYLTSDKFQNTTNSPQNEIKIELYEDKIIDTSKREKSDGNFYILDGDIVSIKINGDTYIGSNSNTQLKTLKQDNQPSINPLDPNNNYAWVIKIDRFFSENRFNGKIANCACVLFEPYNPPSNTISRLNTNCDILKQSLTVIDNVTNFISESCGVSLEALASLQVPFDPKSHTDCTFDKLENIVTDTPRDRKIELNACAECYHWQIRRK